VRRSGHVLLGLSDGQGGTEQLASACDVGGAVVICKQAVVTDAVEALGKHVQDRAGGASEARSLLVVLGQTSSAEFVEEAERDLHVGFALIRREVARFNSRTVHDFQQNRRGKLKIEFDNWPSIQLGTSTADPRLVKSTT
jgi:hypothetical protein